MPVKPDRPTAERCCQIKTEPVNTHGFDPEPQAVEDHPHNKRMVYVQRVPAAGIVHVVARMIGLQPVIRRVIEAPKRQGRAKVIAFGGVVVDHVQNHFDPGVMEPIHHRTESGNTGWPRVARFRCEKADGVVPPVIHKSARAQRAFGFDRLHRQQLDCRHTQVGQMIQHLRRRQPVKRAACGIRYVRVQLRGTAHVCFVDKRFVPVAAQWRAVARKEHRI